MTIIKNTIETPSGSTMHEQYYESNIPQLVPIMNILRGANGSKLHGITGMFWRSYDFEASTRQLEKQLSETEWVAEKHKGAGYGTAEFRKDVESKQIQPHVSGEDGFSATSLSVALRHFINDTCRMLEPCIRLLEEKTGARRGDHVNSLNGYIKQLDRAGISYGFDGVLLRALYKELWNDYKHAESGGIFTGSYSLKEREVVHPVMTGDRLNVLKGKRTEDFLRETLDVVKDFVDYIK